MFKVKLKIKFSGAPSDGGAASGGGAQYQPPPSQEGAEQPSWEASVGQKRKEPMSMSGYDDFSNMFTSTAAYQASPGDGRVRFTFLY